MLAIPRYRGASSNEGHLLDCARHSFRETRQKRRISAEQSRRNTDVILNRAHLLSCHSEQSTAHAHVILNIAQRSEESPAATPGVTIGSLSCDLNDTLTPRLRDRPLQRSHPSPNTNLSPHCVQYSASERLTVWHRLQISSYPGLKPLGVTYPATQQVSCYSRPATPR